jgi:hypothetical protein
MTEEDKLSRSKIADRFSFPVWIYLIHDTCCVCPTLVILTSDALCFRQGPTAFIGRGFLTTRYKGRQPVGRGWLIRASTSSTSPNKADPVPSTTFAHLDATTVLSRPPRLGGKTFHRELVSPQDETCVGLHVTQAVVTTSGVELRNWMASQLMMLVGYPHRCKSSDTLT